MTETTRKPVIHTLESLREHLEWAVQLELFTLPPYLSALYSLKEGANDVARALVRSVAMEEMLHVASAANVLNAVGGKDFFTVAKVAPDYGVDGTTLPHSGLHFPVMPLRFSLEAIEAFMKIEHPSISPRPEADRYHSIGQFYAAIEEGLRYLCDTLPAREVFTGDVHWQVPAPEMYDSGGELVRVSCRDSALFALERIVDQGEGLVRARGEDVTRTIWDGDARYFHQHPEVAHFYRFNEVRVGKKYRPGDKPGETPSGPPFEVDWSAVWPMRPNPRLEQYPPGSAIRRRMTEFRALYHGVLELLGRGFSGRPELFREAVGSMWELKYAALDLMRTPSGDGDTTVGPNFQP